MAANPLPLSILCTVTVTAARQGVVSPTFNQGLIIGNSGVIPAAGGPDPRIRLYTSVEDAETDGFDPSDPEILALGLYFSANPAPNFGWIGCQDPSAIATSAGSITIGAVAGTGYAVGDLFSITHAGAQGGVGKVTAVAGGVPTAIAAVSGQQGTAYVVSANNATAHLTGVGINLEVNIVAIGETPEEALTACRIAQPAWYTAMITTAVDADHILCAQFAQTATPAMQYLYGTSSASALAGTAGNVFSAIKALSLSRAHGAYSTTQGGNFPNNVYIAAAVMGLAMGLNTGLPNSNFTLDAKTLVGIAPEPLSQSQINVFAGTPGIGLGNFGNVYVNYANSYTFYQQGVNGNGTFFDQVLVIDMLAADAQNSVVGVLASLPSIPQDNAGQALVINAVNGAAQRSAIRGSLAGGIWQGQQLLNLNAGDSLPTGYRAQSASFSTQAASDRALRKGMPVILAVILSGSQQSFSIGINVQQ